MPMSPRTPWLRQTGAQPNPPRRTNNRRRSGRGCSFRREEIEGGAGVLELAAPAVELSLAPLDTTKVKAQDGRAGGVQGARRAGDDFVVQGAAQLRVGVTNHRSRVLRPGGA